jgi:hypothetical protein
MPLRAVEGDRLGRAGPRLSVPLQIVPAPYRLGGEGAEQIYTRKGDSGFDLRFHFCPNCGTSILWEGDRQPDSCGIAGGCFADLEFPAPTGSIYEEAMHSWLDLPSVGEHHQHGFPPPPSD